MNAGVSFAPATRARPVRATRLLVVRAASEEMTETTFAHLPELLTPGDVVVVNDAATLPSSVFGKTSRGEPIELRLLGLPNDSRECDAVLFGAGDWRTPTEHRAAPPEVRVGDSLVLAAMEAMVTRIDGPRRLRVSFERERDEAVSALYRAGKPVQYAHIAVPLPLWDVQNVYASEPWAAEMPSAGRPLDFAALDALRKRGIVVLRLTHGAGLSSIGDHALDASLPWIERYRIPAETSDAVNAAKGEGRRVIAVGTSVVRALESAVATNGEGTTTLRIDASHRLGVVSALLTGMHDATTSHADLVSAFISLTLLAKASRFASERGFLGHELGDSCLIMP